MIRVMGTAIGAQILRDVDRLNRPHPPRKQPMTFMHAHAVDELRRRIGPKADRLMHAAGAGSGVALALLERLGVADAFHERTEKGDLTAFIIGINGNRWQGASLRINGTFPETITQAMVGQPLGRVVAGTLCDDVPIRLVSSNQNEVGHWITIDTRVVDTAEMSTPGVGMRCGLAWRAFKGYVAGGAWAGTGDNMIDRVTMMLTLLMGIALAMSLCMAMPDHVGAILSVVVALFTAFMLRPRRHWRRYVHDHVRNHG